MAERRLLATTTGEPYQPVRLTWRIPGRAFALERLRVVRCVAEDVETRRLVIWHVDEALALELGGNSPGPEVEAGGRKVILGTFRFPDTKRMTLEVRSIQRAVGIARLLRPRLGPKVVPVRVRLVNQWFDAREVDASDLDAVDRCLDRDVTVIRPEVTERQMEEALASADTPEGKQQALARWRHSRRHLDVPLVEDFPLCPEEETEQLRDLAMTLNFRLLRAGRRWAGEDVTLRQVIEETVAPLTRE